MRRQNLGRVGASFEALLRPNPIFLPPPGSWPQRNGRLPHRVSFETDAVSSAAQHQNAFPASPFPRVDRLATSYLARARRLFQMPGELRHFSWLDVRLGLMPSALVDRAVQALLPRR